MYGGLRRGELMALRVEHVDLAGGVIHVRRSCDVDEGEIATKNRQERRVPVAAVLRDHLDQHLLDLDWRDQPDGLVFGAYPRSPFKLTRNERTAKRAWTAENERRRAKAHDGEDVALLAPITLHECRHTFASLMIAAGVNAKALSTHVGHSTITITLDRYGHLFPGNEAEAAGLLNAYLDRADTAARLAVFG
jgi:integrase